MFGFGTSGSGGRSPRAKTVILTIPSTAGTVARIGPFGLLAPVAWNRTSGHANLTINASTGVINAEAALPAGSIQNISGTVIGADQVVIPFVAHLIAVATGTPPPPTVLATLEGSFSLREDAGAGALAGTITGRTAGSTLSLADDAGGRVRLSGSNVVRGAVNLDHEAASSHSFTVREALAGASNSPRDTILTLAVTNVFEGATLGALSLDDTSVPEDSATTIAILGATPGSTITLLSGSLPAGMTLNGAARTISGTPTTSGSAGFTLRESLADSPNSPRDTALAIEVTAVASAPTNTVLPAISGTAQEGQTLSVSNGTWTGSPTSYTRQWLRDGVAISGATGTTRLLTSADVGAAIAATVTATNAGGSTPATSAATAAVTAAEEPGGTTLDPTLRTPAVSFAAPGTWPPVATIDVFGGLNDGDVIQWRKADTYAGLLAASWNTHTVDGGPIDMGLAAIISPALTFVQVRLRVGTSHGPSSNVALHGDTVAPSITSSATPSAAERQPVLCTITTNELCAGIALTGPDAGLLAVSAGPAASFAVTLASGDLDYETKASYAFTATPADLAGNVGSALPHTVAVDDVDDTPGAFAFADVTGATASTLYESNTITVAGLGSGVSVAVTLTGTGEYRKNGGGWTTAPTTAVNGDTFQRRLTSAADPLQALSGTLRIGEGQDTWSVTTASAGSSPEVAASGARGHNLAYAAGSHTFAGCDIGPADSTRVVVVAVTNLDSVPNAGLTVGGIAATRIGAAGERISLYRASVPSGTSADIAAECGYVANVGIAWAAITGVSAAPTEAPELPFGNYGPDEMEVAVVTPDPGLTVIGGMTMSSDTRTWTGASEAASANVGTHTAFIAVRDTPGNATAGFTGPSYPGLHLKAASFGG